VSEEKQSDPSVAVVQDERYRLSVSWWRIDLVSQKRGWLVAQSREPALEVGEYIDTHTDEPVQRQPG
jgi:hypothetical protein